MIPIAQKGSSPPSSDSSDSASDSDRRKAPHFSPAHATAPDLLVLCRRMSATTTSTSWLQPHTVAKSLTDISQEKKNELVI